MEFTYSTNVQDLHDQLESCQITAKMSSVTAVATLIGFVAYLRSGTVSVSSRIRRSPRRWVCRSRMCQGDDRDQAGCSQLVAKSKLQFATPDESIVETVCALVDAHNGKAVSGIYSALVGPQEKERRTLAAIVASMINEASAAGYEPSAIVEEVIAQLSK